MNNIIFTRDIRADLQLKLADFGIADIFVLVDNNSRNFCQRSFEDFGIPEEHIITIPEGEHHKSLESVAEIWQVLSDQGARRKAEKREEVLKAKTQITETLRELFVPEENKGGIEGIMQHVNTGIAVYDGVMTGIKIMRKVRSYFTKKKK